MSATTAPSGATAVWDRVRTYSPPGRYLPVIGTFALFVGMFVIGGIQYDSFADTQNFLNLLRDNSFLIVLAVGMTFVILTGGIDLSVGSVAAMSTMVLAKTLEMGWSTYAAMGAVLVVGTLFGALMGLLIHYLDIQPFIATLAGLFLARGITFLISTEQIPIADEKFVELAFKQVALAGGYFTYWTVVVALLTVVVAAYILARTRFGRTVYAVGGNEASAMLMGLRVAAVKVGVYAISGFCAALAGILYGLYLLSGNSRAGIGWELDAIAAVVIGGTLLTGGRGFVIGSFIGVLVLGTIQALINFDGTLDPAWIRIAIGALLLVFVVVQRLMTRRQT